MDLVLNQTVTLNLLRNSFNLANTPPITDYCAHWFYWSMNHYSPYKCFFPKALLRNIYGLKGKCTCVCHYKPVHQHNQRYRQGFLIIGWVLIPHWLCSSTSTGLYKLLLCVYQDFSIPRSRTSYCCWPLGLQQRRHLHTLEPKTTHHSSCFFFSHFRWLVIESWLGQYFVSKDPTSSVFKLLVSRWFPWILNRLVTSSCVGAQAQLHIWSYSS